MFACTASRSRMSTSTSRARRVAIAGARFSGTPRTSASSATTSRAPAAIAASTRWDPTVPAPPVTTTRAPASALACLGVLFGLAPVAKELRGHARHDGAIGYVVRDDRARADDRTLAHGDAWQEHRVHADVGPALHA